MKRLGIDIGSTTLKCAVLDENGEILYSCYRRHGSKIFDTLTLICKKIEEKYPNEEIRMVLSGSAGMGISEGAGIPFVQEVYAEQIAVKKRNPDTDVVIELGGEDAKILFLTDGFEMRMNGSCAGGTGAFIDQMAALMQITPEELNDLASRHEKVCTIASRCGVFAKSDVQPLLNQGARKEDIAAGILYAVVGQTVAGLSQGRQIKGNILYLGGPLTFFSELRKSFDKALKTVGVCPKDALLYVAMGAALSDVGKEINTSELCKIFDVPISSSAYRHTHSLFESKEEYEEFSIRHKKASEGISELAAPSDEMYLGIDAGSTTVKMVLCDKEGNIFRPQYSSNEGDPLPIVKKYLTELYSEYPDIKIKGSAVTGYGEEMIKNAFGVDFGIVETVAHYTAAKKFRPDVDFILDIGGQDIKCFRIRNGLIDSLYLNEACSSGCGSFLQTFASTLGYTSEQFAKLGLFAKEPVDLGSRCTVFMNSSVKQAQKDGAGVENIAAGLSISVVKNALYKVIRCANAESLGKHIVVQGGTFLNDCVLRAFEQEIGHDVIRPEYAPIMGAYGAALYCADKDLDKSDISNLDELESFTHTAKAITCNGCTNHCNLTVNTFGNGKRYIAGNRCSKPLGRSEIKESCDLYKDKLAILEKYKTDVPDPAKRTIGIPMGLNMYELLPFWYTFFDKLGFNVLVSPPSTRSIYLEGQYTIPSDTACYPAKLMHGHIEWLIDRHPDAIFYPDMSYNVEENMGVNHYNCPVVAYYPQVLKMNVDKLKDITFICDFMSLADPKRFEKRISDVLKVYFPDLEKKNIAAAVRQAYEAYHLYLKTVRDRSREIIENAEKGNRPIIVLAGRPYHIDPEINHGIHSLITSLGAAVITEDSISHLIKPFDVDVRNQWTYHARLYSAAKYVANAPDSMNIHLVQLVSFGCGVDAITSDEVRSILETAGKTYTQIKIDEISNMGAVTIRLRSLFAMLDNKKGDDRG